MKNSKFDSKLFSDSIILSESLKLTQIEGTQISQDEMYYLKYMPKTDETSKIQNLKKVIDYSKEFIDDIVWDNNNYRPSYVLKYKNPVEYRTQLGFN